MKNEKGNERRDGKRKKFKSLRIRTHFLTRTVAWWGKVWTELGGEKSPPESRIGGDARPTEQ